MTRLSHGSSFVDARNREGRILGAAARERVIAVAPERVIAVAPERVIVVAPERVIAAAPERVIVAEEDLAVTQAEVVWAEIAAEQGAVVQRVAAVAASTAAPEVAAALSAAWIAAAAPRAARASGAARVGEAVAVEPPGAAAVEALEGVGVVVVEEEVVVVDDAGNYSVECVRDHQRTRATRTITTSSDGGRNEVCESRNKTGRLYVADDMSLGCRRGPDGVQPVLRSGGGATKEFFFG